MDSNEDIVDGDPPVINPYEVLSLERSCTSDQVKSAYRKAALKSHPDKAAPEDRDEAKERFQAVAFAYAVLSDPTRRKRYDATGSTADSVVDADGFDWSDFYREQFRDAVSAEAIARFSETYRGSDEERGDVLAAYELAEGDMDAVYESVMLSSVLEDDTRFRRIIDDAIAAKDVPAFTRYTKENKRARLARVAAARAEAGEAEEYARELGVHDKLFGDKKKGKKKDGGEDGLAALIKRNQQNRASFLDNLEAKYAAQEKGRKGKKRAVEDEPSEEAFQAAAARLKKGTAGGDKSRGKKAKP